MDNMDARHRRALAIVIVSLLVLLGLATWVGTKLGASSATSQAREQKEQLESATTQLSQLQSLFTSLQKNNEALRTQLWSAETGLSQIQSSYGSLQDSNAVLRTQLASAQAELSQVQSKQNALQQDNAALRAQLDTTKSNYDSLVIRYSALEKTKEFTVDGRLKVKLSTEAQLPTAAWVRGEVTNIGNTLIRKVYILVSRYNSDGSLNTVDLPPSVLLNLAPASVGYFSFLSSGETYKVTLLGDY